MGETSPHLQLPAAVLSKPQLDRPVVTLLLARIDRDCQPPWLSALASLLVNETEDHAEFLHYVHGVVTDVIQIAESYIDGPADSAPPLKRVRFEDDRPGERILLAINGFLSRQKIVKRLSEFAVICRVCMAVSSVI